MGRESRVAGRWNGMALPSERFVPAALTAEGPTLCRRMEGWKDGRMGDLLELTGAKTPFSNLPSVW
jgi:hypothetical protein